MLILRSVTFLLLLVLVLTITGAIIGYSKTFEKGVVYGTSISSEFSATDELSATDQEYLEKSVTSVINIRYDGETYLIEPKDINSLLGNKKNISDARDYYWNGEKLKVENMLRKVLLYTDVEDYKYSQTNSNGILREEITHFMVYKNDYGPDIEEAISKVDRVLSTRLTYNKGNQEYISIGKVVNIGTNGEYSEKKYIEFDHSRQLIHAWENGEHYKSWVASGFFDKVAVYGVFDIKNKAANAWSPGAEKWMPYWMAFYWDKKQEAWFGLHQLVYWYDEEGVYWEESSESIGQRKSAGCIRLDRGEMKELYDWAEVGMHLLIYE